MDANIQLSSILVIAGAITTILTAWLKIRSLTKDFKKERDLERAKIIQEAKEVAAKVKADLMNQREIAHQELIFKYAGLETRLDNLEESVQKDLGYIRQKQEGEIRVLGDKIEDLRTELRTQHGQLITMLTKMIDARN